MHLYGLLYLTDTLRLRFKMMDLQENATLEPTEKVCIALSRNIRLKSKFCYWLVSSYDNNIFKKSNHWNKVMVLTQIVWETLV